MKSIRSHERSKRWRNKKETRRRKFSKAEKRAKGRNTCAQKREREEGPSRWQVYEYI